MSINIVLDIDGVLACNTVENVKQALFFKNKGAIMTAIKTHYLFPGVIEFIQFLFRRENIKVSFFSSGDKERNIIFVEQLLKLALQEQGYEEVKHKVRVLSRDDLTVPDDKENVEHHRVYGLWAGNKQKDLSKVLCEEDLLDNTILVDDTPSYVACGQAKNVLYVDSTENRNFEILPSTCNSYHPEGYKFLPSVLVIIDHGGREKKAVKNGKQLLILKKDNGFEVEFLDKNFKYQKQLICVEENKELVAELNRIYQDTKNKNKTGSVIKDAELTQSICQLVTSFDGRAKKICRQANRIYYVAGLLFTALEQSKSNSISLSECLFRAQFKLKKDGETYKPDFKKLSKRDDLYLLGLEKLREINPHLRFTTPQSYVECIQLPSSQEELSALEEAIKNEGDDSCCIM
jgi:hypothetical protein